VNIFESFLETIKIAITKHLGKLVLEHDRIAKFSILFYTSRQTVNHVIIFEIVHHISNIIFINNIISLLALF